MKVDGYTSMALVELLVKKGLVTEEELESLATKKRKDKRKALLSEMAEEDKATELAEKYLAQKLSDVSSVTK